jgi:hypothetical protein
LSSSKIGFPDYANMTAITTNYSCPSDGWILGIRRGNYDGSTYSLKINGAEIAYNVIGLYQQSILFGTYSGPIPVKKGDVITFSYWAVSFMPNR